MAAPGKFQFAIDRGGTFTDVFARCPGGKARVLKLLSEDPANYRDAPTEGIRRVLEEECGVPFPKDQPLDTSRIEWIRMGTTVATNALLERKGERLALLITKGFRALSSVCSPFTRAVKQTRKLHLIIVSHDDSISLSIVNGFQISQDSKANFKLWFHILSSLEVTNHIFLV